MDAVTPLLVEAFATDPGFRYIVPDDVEWQDIASRYFRLAVNDTARRGFGLVEQDLRAVSLWEPPGTTAGPANQMAQLVRLVLILQRNLGRALSLQRFTRGYRPSRPHWYLAYIASDPARRGQGHGSRVLTPMIEYTDVMRLPIYLECSNRDNIAFYLRHGFNLVAEVAIPGGGHVWPMLREPQAS